MINNPLISVIIPAFNVSETLENCINSLFQQSYSNFEIILINDGSIDDTWEKALMLASKDDRLKVFNQNNLGVSPTRNRALQLASGDYFCCVDADDSVNSQYLENLKNGIYKGNDKGLVIQQLKFLDSNGSSLDSINIEFNDEVVEENNYSVLFTKYEIIKFGFNCGKLYNLNLVREYDLKYAESITISEDLIFMLEYILKTEYIHFIKGNDYNYITTAYTLHDTKFASFSSEKELLRKYLFVLDAYKLKFNLSYETLKYAYFNSGDIFMRLVYSMYRLNNNLPKKNVRIKEIRNTVEEFKFCLQHYWLPNKTKEKLSKILLMNRAYRIFDRFRIFIRSSQLKRIAKV